MTVKEKLKSAGHYLAGGGITGGAGFGISEYMKWVADVNVRIRPEILNLNFYEAAVSGHFNDWAFKVNPVGAALVVTTAALIGLGTVYYLKHL
jgi:hypothetical protein